MQGPLLIRPLEGSFLKYASQTTLNDVKARLRPNQPVSNSSLASLCQGNREAFSKISAPLILIQHVSVICVCVCGWDDITRGAEGKEVGRRKCLELDRDKTEPFFINYPAKYSYCGERFNVAWLSFNTVLLFLSVSLPYQESHYYCVYTLNQCCT